MSNVTAAFLPLIVRPLDIQSFDERLTSHEQRSFRHITNKQTYRKTNEIYVRLSTATAPQFSSSDAIR